MSRNFSDSDVALAIEPEETERKRDKRLRRYHRKIVPPLRFAGILLFAAFAWAHNAFVLPGHDLASALAWVSIGALAYTLVGWWTVRRFYDSFQSINLGDLLLVLDGFVALALIYATGAEHSLLFFYLMIRPADQSPSGERRTLFFGILSVVLYLGLAVSLGALGHQVDWAMVWLKAGLIAAFSGYMVGVATSAAADRNQTTLAMRLARSLLGELREKTIELEKEKARAQEASVTKSQFLANMSHEIRTPMNAIIGVNRLQLRTQLSKESKRYARIISSSADNLLQLIDSILDLSKVEAGKLQMDPIPFSLGHLLDHAMALSGPQAKEKGLPLHLERTADLPSWVLGDVARIRQILLNLLGNAIKFTRNGHVVLRVSAADGTIRFEIEDTGIGISEQGQANLFDPFAQADSSTARHFGGTGLGLSISRHLVEAMDGRIEVKSEIGVGSTFTVELPLEETEPSDEPQTGSMPIPLRPAKHPAKILVADDNEINRMLTRAELEVLGLEVDTVCDGYEAVEAASKVDYDLIFLDCQMPGIDGYEAARQIRSLETDEQRVPIIALTAQAMKGDRERCLAAGMDDHITKPFQESDLAEVLSCWLSAFDPPAPHDTAQDH